MDAVPRPIGYDIAMLRLFVALWPPASVISQLQTIPRTSEPRIRWVAASNVHVTLHFIGDADPHEVRSRLQNLRIPDAHAHVGPNLRRLGRDALILPVGGINRVAATVYNALNDLGPRRRGRSRRQQFVGHLTLARVKQEDYEVEEQSFQASFPVREIALVASRRESNGVVYETLCTWPTQYHKYRARDT